MTTAHAMATSQSSIQSGGLMTTSSLKGGSPCPISHYFIFGGCQRRLSDSLLGNLLQLLVLPQLEAVVYPAVHGGIPVVVYPLEYSVAAVFAELIGFGQLLAIEHLG